jgi:hypothetical protein
MKIKSVLLAFPLLVILLIISGCDPDPGYTNSIATSGKRAYSEFITEIYGCKIYYIHIENNPHNMYLTKCENENETNTNLRFNQGKLNINSAQIGQPPVIPPAKIPYVNDPNSNNQYSIEHGQSGSIGTAATQLDNAFKNETTDEQSVLDLADKIKKRRDAISKLSPEDRALLGLDGRK